jgi:DNA-binding transcriptional LysR family regulator
MSKILILLFPSEIDMELRHLRYLLAVADAKSFTGAAAVLHVAQPALSQQIRALEKEVGVRLVDRGARTRGLTEAGDRFARRARAMLEEARAATEEMAAFAGARVGRVRFGSALQSLTEGRLAAALARFHARHPGLEVEFREAHTLPLLDLLEAGALDLALIHRSRGTGGAEPSGLSRAPLEFESLYEEPLLLAVGPRHPLARRREVRWVELSGEEFISYGPGATLRDLVLSRAREAGVTLRMPVSAENLGTVRALVSVGLGVTVLPRAAFGLPGPPVRAVGLTAPRVLRVVTLARNTLRYESPASRTFRDFLRAELGP